MNNEIDRLTILPGISKASVKEFFDKIDIVKSEVVAVVGSTGSGKSQLLYDIERLSQGDTKTLRKVLVDSKIPKKEWRFDPRKKLVASLSQSMNFCTDSTVKDFLILHMKARGKPLDEGLVDLVIREANEVTGEPIFKDMNLLSLSGGQTRALMVSDIANISDSPMVLVDEIENAGIKKDRAINLLVKEGKIVLLVTHDPVLALGSNKRIVLKNGGIVKILKTTEREKSIARYLSKIDAQNFFIREEIRSGRLVEQIPLRKINSRFEK